MSEYTKASVLRYCEELHMMCTGAMDGLNDVELDERAAWLLAKLNTWAPSGSAYDATVHQLITVTLAEYWQKRAEGYL